MQNAHCQRNLLNLLLPMLNICHKILIERMGWTHYKINLRMYITLLGVIEKVKNLRQTNITTSLNHTSLFAYAEYLALTTCSALAAPYSLALLWSGPQHFIYEFWFPQGQGETAAPPNPEVDWVRFPIVFRVALFFFFPDCLACKRVSEEWTLVSWPTRTEWWYNTLGHMNEDADETRVANIRISVWMSY